MRSNASFSLRVPFYFRFIYSHGCRNLIRFKANWTDNAVSVVRDAAERQTEQKRSHAATDFIGGKFIDNKECPARIQFPLVSPFDRSHFTVGVDH